MMRIWSRWSEMLLQVPASCMGDGLSDYDRLKKVLTDTLGGSDIEIPVKILRMLPDLLRKADGKITVAAFLRNMIILVSGIDAGDTTNENFGIAVDIGTTTVAAELVELANGRIIASKTAYNAQIECGVDVISRINYAENDHDLDELRTKVLATINGLIKTLSADNGIDQRSILNATIAGNTVMTHLLLGIVPEYIRLEPYTPAIYNPLEHPRVGDRCRHRSARIRSYRAFGWQLCGRGYHIRPPLQCPCDGFGSSTCAYSSTSVPTARSSSGTAIFDGMCLFGGSGIRRRRDRKGHARIARCDRTGRSRGRFRLGAYSTIGDAPAVGICGSGMICLVSELFCKGWIDAAGKLDRTRECRSVEINGKSARYVIAPASASPDGNPVFVTESDIDNLIRAKAAIFSACRVLLRKIDMDFEYCTKIYIAGGFGRYIDIRRSAVIGLIPDLPEDHFKFLGNTSLTGAYMMLVSAKHRAKADELAAKITYIDLSSEPGYMDQYTAAMFLPHTDAELFPNRCREEIQSGIESDGIV